MSNAEIESTRGLSPTGIPEASIPKSTTHTISRAGGSIQDTVIGQEPSGHVKKTIDPAKPIANAHVPPLSTKPVPTSSIADRLKERLKKVN